MWVQSIEIHSTLKARGANPVMAQSEKGNAIHDLSSLDATDMLPLNNAHGKETSTLDDASLTALLDMAFTPGA